MANRGSVSRRAQRVIEERRRRMRITAAAALTVIAGAAVIAVLLTSGNENDDDTTTIDVEMFEFGFAGDLTATAGAIRLSATNAGRIGHNIGVRSGPISAEIAPGASPYLDLGELAPGTYELYCDIVGHVEAGMVAPLVITEPVIDE